jgi:SPW repeat
MKWLSWSNVVLGLWLSVAPFALGYSSVHGAEVEDVLMGLLIVVFAMWRAMGAETAGGQGVSWAVTTTGLWVLFAPFTLGYSVVHVAAANDVIVGLLVSIFGAMHATAPARTAHVG